MYTHTPLGSVMRIHARVLSIIYYIDILIYHYICRMQTSYPFINVVLFIISSVEDMVVYGSYMCIYDYWSYAYK